MKKPVFAILAVTGGSYEGAIIRDMRLANCLHRRGFKVVVYWLMESNRELVDPGIGQSFLARPTRYYFKKPNGFLDALGALLEIYPQSRRRRFTQQHPGLVPRLLRHFVTSMADGCPDTGLVRRLERFMRRDEVTHVLPTFAMICPIALAAKERGNHPFDYLATFQGEEIFANFATSAGRLDDYYAQIRRCVAASPWPAIAVSDDYAIRMAQDIGIDRSQLRTIYPGIDLPGSAEKPPFSVLKEKMPDLDPNIPIVSYFGRQDTEKGIDLLLYAARILQDRGIKLQLVICGGSSFGWEYQQICKQIAEHLRLRTYWKRRVSDEVRAALYAHSRCVVYPSIHREPFGMVAAETMSYGTPVLVPNYGGVAESIRSNGSVGGLTFEVWNTNDLAAKLELLLTDQKLYDSLAGQARSIAQTFNVEVMTDRVLAHLGLPARPEGK